MTQKLELLEQLMGASLVTAGISGYFILQQDAIVAGATLFASGIVTGVYIGDLIAKSDKSSYGAE